MSGSIVAVDVGGTFTDIVFSNGSGIQNVIKIPTTRNPEEAILEAIKRYSNGRVQELYHATTLATNALLGQEGFELGPVALLTTKGFKDIIEIGRQNRPKLYDLFFERPKVLVDRNNRYEVSERVDVSGNVLKKPTARELKRIISDITKKKIKSVAISFLHSYINPKNELEVESALRTRFEYVSTSSKVAPEPREYERTSTTVVNAALMPIVSRYIKTLNDSLQQFGSPRLGLMASSGGLVSVDEVISRPIEILESGPAAGVIATAEFSKLVGLNRVISFDMGGTTAKAATVSDFEVEITSEYEVGGKSHHGRITKGSGYPVRFPFVDLAEVSAGGGTIIWCDPTHALKVGPVSAGSEPGPMCYGKGGNQPTITDANLALGIIKDSLLDGQIKLSKDAAIDGLTRLGHLMGLDPYEVARDAIQLVNLEMARAIRLVTVERGLDPKDYVLVAFGGAGPQHAAKVAEEMGINHVVIPPEPSEFSALGLMLSNWKYEARMPYPKDVSEGFQKLDAELLQKFPDSVILHYADCRYVGQGSELTIALPGSATSFEEVKRLFVEAHLRAYGFSLERQVEVVTIRAFAVIKTHLPMGALEAKPLLNEPVSRRILENGKWVDVPSISRAAFQVGEEIMGPALIDEYGSTTYVPSGWRASKGAHFEIDLRWEGH